MGKRLLIVWGDTTLHDGEVDSIDWSESSSGVKVVGKIGGQRNGGGILGEIIGGLKSQNAGEVAARRAAYEQEKAAANGSSGDL
jgi:hypothetical protein